MSAPSPSPAASRLRAGLLQPESSDRLKAALDAGTDPDPKYIDPLVERCAVEPDFYVRDMLTWALTRHPAAMTVPRLVMELRRDAPQARSQALHTLSKIGDPVAWPAITTDLLRDPDDEVARSAWRVAVVLAPPGDKPELARQLASQLGRGGREVQLSLSRALVVLADAARAPVAEAASSPHENVRAHALATERLLDHPEENFDEAIHEARRMFSLTGAPMTPAPDADQ